MGNAPGDDIGFISALADLLRDSDLNEIEVKRDLGDQGELRVRLSRGQGGGVMQAMPHVSYPQPAQQPVPNPPQPALVAAAAPEDPAEHPGAVTSPMVGTVYVAAEPGAAAYVKVGDSVDAGQTLLIIEAMKTMNQIPAPRGGTVKRILVTNGTPVEYGAPLMIIE